MERMSDILAFEISYNELWQDKYETTIKGSFDKMKYLSFKMETMKEFHNSHDYFNINKSHLGKRAS